MARLQSLQSQLNALRSTIHRKPRVTRPSRFESTTSNRSYQDNATQSEGDKHTTDDDDQIDSRLNVSKLHQPGNFTWQKTTPFAKRLHCALAKLVDVSHLSASKNQRESEDTGPEVLFDSGANCCITNNKEDFHGTYSACSQIRHISGLDSRLLIQGSGTVAWTFKANNHMLRTLRLPCHYVPGCNSRIASLQQILLAYPRESINVTADSLELSGDMFVPGITVQYSISNLLPTKPTYHKIAKCNGMNLVAPEHTSNLYCHRVEVMMNVGDSIHSLNEPKREAVLGMMSGNSAPDCLTRPHPRTPSDRPTHEAPSPNEPMDIGAEAFSRVKKRKNVAPVKRAPKSKKASTRSSSRVPNPIEVVPANDHEAPDESIEANAVTPSGQA